MKKRKISLYRQVNGKWKFHSTAGEMDNMELLMMNLVMADGWMLSAVDIK